MVPFKFSIFIEKYAIMAEICKNKLDHHNTIKYIFIYRNYFIFYYR